MRPGAASWRAMEPSFCASERKGLIAASVCESTEGRLTALAGEPPPRTVIAASATSTPTFSWASAVEAPRCGERWAFGRERSGWSLARGSSTNTSKPQPPHLPEAVQSMREGKWDRKTLSGSELFGKTLGVLGLGRIGAEVSKRALAFGMKVLAYDPYLTEARAKALGVSIATLDEVFALSDYITVHMPLIEKGKQGATEGMVDEAAFAKMKKGV
ncbi:MAG: hypothetical protein EBV31_09165, partial [Verrucomicrobia bacterium]|nr:hypothetical protein [Verrucomicrobiota bacterium]